jgi:hypothetical protein
VHPPLLLLAANTADTGAAAAAAALKDNLPLGYQVCMVLCLVQMVLMVILHSELIMLMLQDTTSTASAQAAFSTAVTRAQQHSCTVQQLLQSQPPAADGSCWPAVQAAAQHLLSSYRAACLRLQQLTSLLAGREKLLHQVQLEQQQEPGQQHVVGSHSSKSSSSSSSSLRQPIAAAAGGLQRQPLTAFELHLIRTPVLLQQHEQALHKACGLLQQQLQCIQAAQTFFAWAGSVLQEEQKAAAAAQPPPPPAGSSITTSKTYCQQHHATISTPSVADVLPLLRQLPDVATPAAETVLERIVKQLRQAVVDGAAAGVACLSSHTAAAGRNNSSYSSGTSRSFDRGSSSSMDKNQAAADVVKEQLAKLSVTPAAGAAAELHCDSAAAEQLLQPYWQVAATAMLDQGFVLGCSEKLSALPSDLKEQLQKGGCAQQPEEQQRQQPARAWHQLSLSQDQMSALHARFHHLQQLQQNPPGQPSPPSAGPTQRTAATATATATRNPGHAEEDVGNAAVSLADARLLQDVRVREGQAELVPVASEVLRLQELSLLVAKQLAEKRAVNKKQLQALQDAILCAAGSEQLLVLK